MTQTLEHGKTIAQKYGKLRGVGGGIFMCPPLHNQLMVIGGASSSGKSALLQSCPDAYIFNTDLSGVTTPTYRATMWPGFDTEGNPAEGANPGEQDSYEDKELSDQQGFPVHLKRVKATWNAFLEQKKILEQMADDNDPARPKIIVIDTLTTCIRMCKPWVTEYFGKQTFGELHGQQAWGTIYDHLLDFGIELHSKGYGVCYVVHFGDKIEGEGEHRRYIENVPTISDKLWNRIYPVCSFVAVVEVRRESFQEDVAVKNLDGTPKLLGNGKPRTRRESGTRPVHYLTFEHIDQRNAAKRRVAFTSDLKLSSRDAWTQLEDEYSKARNRMIQPEGEPA